MQVLFITVDVARDTPAVLAEYVKSFDAPLIGLTGTRKQIDRVVKQYDASYTISTPPGSSVPQVSHTAFTYLIDKDGKLRGLFGPDEATDTIAAVLERALQLPS